MFSQRIGRGLPVRYSIHRLQQREGVKLRTSCDSVGRQRRPVLIKAVERLVF